MQSIEGFVALIDVLGFSAMVQGPQGKDGLSHYLESVQEVIEPKETEGKLEFVLFSDSIVVSTRDLEAPSLAVLLRGCSRLLGALLEKEIPIRGAIAAGTFYRERSSNGTFVAGRPIIEAYQVEQAQNWVGITLAQSTLRACRRVPDLCFLPDARLSAEALNPRINWPMLLRRNESIPFHDGTFDGFSVIPTPASGKTGQYQPYLGKCINALDRLKTLAPTPQAQQKYTSTARWLETIRSQWGILQSQDFPQDVHYHGVPSE